MECVVAQLEGLRPEDCGRRVQGEGSGVSRIGNFSKHNTGSSIQVRYWGRSLEASWSGVYNQASASTLSNANDNTCKLSE